jgi:hypothetical protein
MSSDGGPNMVEPEAIRQALQQAGKPLSSTALSKLLQQKSGKAFKPALDAEVRAGRIYPWGADLYWDRNPRTMARERLLNLAGAEILANASLNKRAASESPKIGPRVIPEVRKELVRENLLREVGPPRGSKSKAKLNVNVRHPAPYLEQEMERLLAEFGVPRSRERIRALLALEPAEPEPSAEPEVGEVAEKIFAAMNRIAFAPGTTVTFYRLRQQPELASLPKPVFDQAAFLLQHQRRALLAVHDHASRLPSAEQDQLVTDGLGTYYVSIYAL